MKAKFSTSELNSIFKQIEKYCKIGNSYVMELSKSKSKRSLSQNSYYWGVVIALFSQSTGYTSNESHQYLAGLHLSYIKERIDQSALTFVKSTTELDTLSFEQYIDQCRLFMWHELNIHVPLPNQIDEDFLIQMSNIYSY